MLPPILRLLRPGDWVKNAFVLVPPLFWIAGEGSHASREQLHAGLMAVAFTVVSFCMAGSGFYALNDTLDAAEDRLHPVKRKRPVASGAVSARAAAVLGCVLIGAAVGIAAMVNTGVMAVIILYVALQVAYNIRLKYVRLVDVATVASGFVLRAVAGAAALAIQVSIWLVVVVFVLTLFLGFVKRLSDLRVAEAARARGESLDWKPRAGYNNSEDLNWLLAVTGTSTVLTYLMYALSGHARHIFGMRALGFALLTPLVLVVIHRMYTRANDGLSESPTTVLREDRSAAVSALLYVAGVVAFLYWPPAEQLVGRIFQDLP